MAFAVIVWTQSIVSPQWKQLNPLGKYTHERSLIDADQLISQMLSNVFDNSWEPKASVSVSVYR